ncbi:hypothetical protein PM082_004555 [Marasmius tenuissimus]|nr:hypothetical protein PM082_004555 [Marasmius tenuissimus]
MGGGVGSYKSAMIQVPIHPISSFKHSSALALGVILVSQHRRRFGRGLHPRPSLGSHQRRRQRGQRLVLPNDFQDKRAGQAGGIYCLFIHNWICQSVLLAYLRCHLKFPFKLAHMLKLKLDKGVEYCFSVEGANPVSLLGYYAEPCPGHTSHKRKRNDEDNDNEEDRGSNSKKKRTRRDDDDKEGDRRPNRESSKGKGKAVLRTGKAH